jgi:hypothetical protein
MAGYKLITCMLTQHVAIDIMTRLKDEKNIITSNITHARGTSSQSVFHMHVVEIMTVLVTQEESDEIFDYLFNELKLYEPHNGMIYQEAVKRSTHYTLPDIKNN